MSTPAAIRWPRTVSEAIPDALMFAAMMVLAWWLGWRTTDLLWGSWLAGLVIGYLILLVGLAGLWGRAREHQGVGALIPTAMMVYFSIHFLGFHWLVASLLPALAPLEALRGGVFSTGFWKHLFAAYWPMLLLGLVAEHMVLRRALARFDQVSPYLPVVRAWVIYLPLFFLVLLGELTGLYGVDHIVVYVIAALGYYSPWRIEARQDEPGQ